MAIISSLVMFVWHMRWKSKHPRAVFRLPTTGNISTSIHRPSQLKSTMARTGKELPGAALTALVVGSATVAVTLEVNPDGISIGALLSDEHWIFYEMRIQST